MARRAIFHLHIAKGLVEGNEVKCIIKSGRGKSKWNFTIKPNGFADLYQPTMYEFIKNREEENRDKPDYRKYYDYSNAMDSLGDYENAKELSEKWRELYEKMKAKEDEN